jgi:AcrR family transcriptional regulator
MSAVAFKKSKRRRSPRQTRARQTVEAVLDAVIRILKREGFDAITTNRIAEVAGVSIGSVYQYFADKRSIFVALHTRHVDEIDRLVESKLIEQARAPLDQLVRAMIEAMVEAHAVDPELHELLMTQVPHRADATRSFAHRLHGAFRLAIQTSSPRGKRFRNLDLTVFMVTKMVDALSHAAVLERPKNVSLAHAKEETVRAVLAYLKGI